MKNYPLIHKIGDFDAVILAHGDFPHTDIPLGLLDRAPFVCACDGAVNHYPQADAIVGDGDSVPEDLRDRLIQIDEQEDNDLTKATRYCLSKGMRRIAYLGTTGKREDHTLGNISLIVRYVQEMGIDILCFTGHKSLLGPQGTGGMVVRKGLAVRPLKSGGSGVQTYRKEHPVEMPTALEAGTLNGHGIAGLAAAVEYIRETGIDSIREREMMLMRRFYEGVKDLPGVRIYGNFSLPERCPVVAVNLGDYDSSEVADELFDRWGICTRPGAHCAPLMHEALGTVEQGAVRFSFSHFNTEEEVDTAVEALKTLAAEG